LGLSVYGMVEGYRGTSFIRNCPPLGPYLYIGPYDGPRGGGQFLMSEVPLYLNLFRGGLVFKAHRWLYHSTLGSRVIKKKQKVPELEGQHGAGRGDDPRHTLLFGLSVEC